MSSVRTGMGKSAEVRNRSYFLPYKAAVGAALFRRQTALVTKTRYSEGGELNLLQIAEKRMQ
jgi:hypothetical protein